MKVITEIELRSQFTKEPFTEFFQGDGQLLTPSALQFLRDKGVAICTEQQKDVSPPLTKESEIEYQVQGKRGYISAYDGGVFTKKPEHMTQLHGNLLVSKDDPAIIFRGKLDAFQAELLIAQVDGEKSEGFIADLTDILHCAREVMKADVLEKSLEVSQLLGLENEELRAHSHNPKKYYGVGHILPEITMGKRLLTLNLLRTRARELELAAVAAYHRGREYQRGDILKLLNRLSSALYIMMVRERAGYYDK